MVLQEKEIRRDLKSRLDKPYQISALFRAVLLFKDTKNNFVRWRESSHISKPLSRIVYNAPYRYAHDVRECLRHSRNFRSHMLVGVSL